MIHVLYIPGWQPTPLNRLLGGHWGRAAQRKAHDRDVLGRAVLAHGVPRAETRRLVEVRVILPKGQRACDPDALWKSLCDGLVQAGALVNDSSRWVRLGEVRYARGEELETFILLEDC